MLHWRRDFSFVSVEKERLWIHSELKKIRFDQGRPAEKSVVETDGPDVYEFYIQNRFKTAV